MASTSPYQQNDYQAVSTYRPYKLPVNDILKANMAINAYWDEGARKVKNIYNTALDIKLSLAPNQQIRDQFMKESEKELSKLSTMNLADPSVQRQGIGIYQPLFKDRGIMSDSQATAHIDRVHMDALSYRNKDGGKFYSMDNHQYALSGSDEFKNSKDRMAGEKFLSNKKEYEPYYDYTNDLAEAVKTCPKSSAISESPSYTKEGKMTGYSEHSELKGQSAAHARVCIEANMPPKGYRQLQIEGSVRYKNNPDVLASDTMAYLGGVSENFSKELQTISASITNIRDDKKIPEADKAKMIEALTQKQNSINLEITENGKTMDKLAKKDYSDLNANYDQYAGAVYTYRKLYKKALAAEYQEVVKKYIADPVQVLHIKNEYDKEMRGIDFNYDVALSDRQFEQKMKLERMKGTTDPNKDDAIVWDETLQQMVPKPGLAPVTGNLAGQGPEANNKAYIELNEKLGKINTDIEANDMLLYNKIIQRGENDPVFQSELLKAMDPKSTMTWQNFKDSTKGNRFFERQSGARIKLHDTSWFKTYFKGHKSDVDLNTWSSGVTEAQLATKTMNMKLDAVNDQVFRNLKELNPTARNYQEFVTGNAAKQSITVGGQTITGADIINARQGNYAKGLTRGTEKMLVGTLLKSQEVDVDNIMLGGQDVNSPDNVKVREFAESINNQYSKFFAKVDAERSKVIGETGWIKEKWTHTVDEKGPMINSLRSQFPVKNGDNKTITIIQSDFDGGVRISHPDVTNADIDKYRAMGFGTTAEIVAPGIVELKGTTYNVVPKGINSPALKDAAYQMSTLSQTTAFQNATPGEEIEKHQIKIDTRIAGERRTATIKTYKGADAQPEYHVYIEGVNSSGPTITAHTSQELFEKLSLFSQKQGVEFKQ